MNKPDLKFPILRWCPFPPQLSLLVKVPGTILSALVLSISKTEINLCPNDRTIKEFRKKRLAIIVMWENALISTDIQTQKQSLDWMIEDSAT
jgi:hypothetical protein